jgi:hypothetical protein
MPGSIEQAPRCRWVHTGNTEYNYKQTLFSRISVTKVLFKMFHEIYHVSVDVEERRLSVDVEHYVVQRRVRRDGKTDGSLPRTERPRPQGRRQTRDQAYTSRPCWTCQCESICCISATLSATLYAKLYTYNVIRSIKRVLIECCRWWMAWN